MLAVGEWVEGSFWPEPVEIKRCEALNDTYYVVEALGRTTRTYFESVLDRYQLDAIRRIQSQPTRNAGNPLALLQAVQAEILHVDRRFSVARSQGNPHVLPLPHQIEAVYGRLLQAPVVRFLLADDPGAGKTIMAGMLIRELRVRGLADRILVLVPPLVLAQWQQELHEKFGEPFRIVSRASWDGQGNPFAEASRCLTSIYWAARPEIKALISQPDWDLVIVDEAHKMAAYTHGKKARKVRRTQIYRLGEVLLPEAPQCLLLTATPHKGDPENFRHLMRLVDPDVFQEVDPHDVMRERANPFIIRRLKESMVNFDGTPIFPPRTTKTIGFDLSPEELDLYEAVTRYVRDHFNQAQQRKNGGAAFAMMLLQRRLSSSLEAITLSLVRRRERLQALLAQTVAERRRWQEQWAAVDDEEEAEAEEASVLDEALVGAIADIDPEALQDEIFQLDRLIELAHAIRAHGVERKYQELESTVFGAGGLLARGEKLLIFTEARDTLRYLARRLGARLGAEAVATIDGEQSMEQRQQQVEHFRHQARVMIATDAGGESINLQFCRQMINYDIPWNPNRLEQRMGRIHRIGQTEEVFVFNMVAANTREGDVMQHLLRKMEQMAQDLGAELVYNFLGDILEGPYGSLAAMMEECVMGRQTLEEIVAGLERTLSEEHQRLLALAAEERLDSDTVDVPQIRAQQQRAWAEHIPERVYEQFARAVFKAHGVTLSDTDGAWAMGRVPRALREQLRLAQSATGLEGDLRAADINRDSPLYLVAEQLAESNGMASVQPLQVRYATPEPLDVAGFQISVRDGHGQEIYASMVHWARRRSGTWIQVDPYWWFDERLTEMRTYDNDFGMHDFQSQALNTAIESMNRIRQAREAMVDKKAQYLRRAFDGQYQHLLERLNRYQRTNSENRNSALINQATVRLRELETRRRERLARLDRERAVQIRPVRAVYAAHLEPLGAGHRIIPQDWEFAMQEFVLRSGYQHLMTFPAFGLVDFYAETEAGEPVYFIGTCESDLTPGEGHLKDLKAMAGQVVQCEFFPDGVREVRVL